MNKPLSLFALFSFSALAALAGCSSSRDVKVQGTAESSSALTSPLKIRVYDLADEKDPKLVESFDSDAQGKFDKTISFDGDRVKIVAWQDADGSGKCTKGELSGTATGDVKDDAVTVKILLGQGDCDPLAE